jgi:RND family efflux transporter MFP subunit
MNVDDGIRLLTERLMRALFTFVCIIMTSMPTRASMQDFDCLLEPRLRIKLATPVAGVLKDVPVDRGATIQKGDILARLESSVEEAALMLAKAKAESDASVRAREARLVFLEKKRDRTTQLQSRGNASDAARDEADSDYNVAVQDLRDAKANIEIAKLEVVRSSEVLRQRSIVSPISGVVVERSLLGGEYAYEQAPIMTIAQIDPLNVEVFLPISLYGTIHVGMQATVKGEKPVGGTYVATVEIVDPLVESRSGTFGIRLLLPNPGNLIPAGLRCKIELPKP